MKPSAMGAVILLAAGLPAARAIRNGPGVATSLAQPGSVSVRGPVAYDVSPSLGELATTRLDALPSDCAFEEGGCGLSPAGPGDAAELADTEDAARPAKADDVVESGGAVDSSEPAEPAGRAGPWHDRPAAVPVQGASIEQRSQGTRPAAVLLESFDGQGYGMVGPQGEGGGNNPSDNSLAVGPDHIVEIVNSRMAVYSKKGDLFEETGRVLYGPIGTNILFAGFGGQCEVRPNGDAVVRYDQLANRWLYVMPLFRRAPSEPGEEPGPYGMCYAVSAGPNPLGPYYRYEYERPLFPDYPRPAVWPDGYYVPTSTGDDVIEKHACVIDRTRMLRGEPATEQCVIIPDVNFLNNADIDGPGLPPPGAPNIMMATGGTQLREDFDDDGIYVWEFHVDWDDPDRTEVTGPRRIAVAPYHYLCDGQLTRCVPQPGTEMRLDAQGDKIMQRLVYRNIDGRESIVAVHSVNTSAGAGGVRWYEFRLDAEREVRLHQQGTYAPDGFYRWMASPAMDRHGNIGIGYSFGGTPNFAGQRFAGRLADDPPGLLTLHETVLVHGQAAQTNTLRWQDYTQTAMDPTDDCTIWYVGDYLKAGAPSYTTRIGAFRLPECLRGTVSGTSFFDVDHDGMRDPTEPGLPGWRIAYAGVRGPRNLLSPPSDTIETQPDGGFRLSLPADPAWFDPTYTFTADAPANGEWIRTGGGMAYASRGPSAMREDRYTIALEDRDDVVNVDFGFTCVIPNADGSGPEFWLSDTGRAALAAADQTLPESRGRGGRGGFGGGRGAAGGWRALIGNALHLSDGGGGRFAVTGQGSFDEAYDGFARWLRTSAGASPWDRASAAMATTALNVTWGGQSASATVHDPVRGDWTAIDALVDRVGGLISARLDGRTAATDTTVVLAYAMLLEELNGNRAEVTPARPERCPPPF